eukprot:s308_g11.t1
MRAFGALAAVLLWRRCAADGGCAVGWTKIDDACFKVTEGSQSFSASWTACSSMWASATVATVVNEEQNLAASQLLNSSSWIGWVDMGTGHWSWLDGSTCRYGKGVAGTAYTCTRLEPSSGTWTHSYCETSHMALCAYPLQQVRNCACDPRYEVLEGYCEPNSFEGTLCSVSSSVSPQAPTCVGDFAPNNLPGYGDWSRETGFAYLHPDSCDEDCVQWRCNIDPGCQGYTWALGAINGQSAASLKNSISGSNPWSGYQCKVKTMECSDDQTPVSTSSMAQVQKAILALLLFQGCFLATFGWN